MRSRMLATTVVAGLDAASDAFDKGEASFKEARADGQGLTDAAKQAGRGALEPTEADAPAGTDDLEAPPPRG